ncbi:hypothetical protein BMI91_19510 [Thioclava sediminum]|uniref:Exonuclease domain-containing protein n=1 Tax=Thioclava sediminum TaxID=1915319 RepID=A0ABX3MSU8_9RHOB|nr:hypothetical protein [Thioclava sediminum]OOY22471.1 hypothetical protein BMI91_19510 [Thioclava sediminum]
MATDDLMFIDFEASSLSPNSWPIEVGLSWIIDGEVETWSSLIKPHPRWPADDWSARSEGVHRISRDELDDAPTCWAVANELLPRIRGKVLVSDYTHGDQRWLDRLLTTAGIDGPMPRLDALVVVAFARFEGLKLDLLYERLERLPIPHRAGPDSARLAKAVLSAQRLGDLERFRGMLPPDEHLSRDDAHERWQHDDMTAEEVAEGLRQRLRSASGLSRDE